MVALNSRHTSTTTALISINRASLDFAGATIGLSIILVPLQVMLSVKQVNAPLYTAVLTQVLVLIYALIEATAVSAGIDRVASIAIGTPLAFEALALLGALKRSPSITTGQLPALGATCLE